MTFSFKHFWYLLWRDPLGLHLYKGAHPPSFLIHFVLTSLSQALSSLSCSSASKYSCSSASKHSSFSQVLPSTPLSLKYSQAFSTSFKCFHTKHIGGTSLFELYSILPRECTRGKIQLMNSRGRAPVPYYTKVTNRRWANLL